MQVQVAASVIEVWPGDITRLDTEAIVNAANSSLLGGGGVDGAIHRAAGPELLQACIPLNGCRTGEAKITPGFRLKAAYVIHTVGPVYRDGLSGESALLENCYRNSLQLAIQKGLSSVAFPAISTGVYRFPAPAAAEIAIKTVAGILAENETIKRVVFAVFSSEMQRIYEQILERDYK